MKNKDKECEKIYYAITLNDHFCISFCSFSKRYYGTLAQIRTFINSLSDDDFHNTKIAFRQFELGDKDAKHSVAYGEEMLLEPVELVDEGEIRCGAYEGEFINLYGWEQPIRYESATVKQIIIKDKDRFIRCIAPKIRGFQHQSPISEEWYDFVYGWGHPGVLVYGNAFGVNYVTATLYFKESMYEDVRDAIASMRNTPSVDCICEDIFADG